LARHRKEGGRKELGLEYYLVKDFRKTWDTLRNKQLGGGNTGKEAKE